MAKRLPGIEISEQIPLDGFDPEGKTWVQFQRPRRWEREQLSRLRAQSVLEWTNDEQGTVRQREIVPEPVMDSERVAMCLVDSNLEDSEGNKVFVPAKSCRQARKSLSPKARDRFYEVWGDLPDDVAEEIILKLAEWHPPFDWRNPDRGED
jgi:hypothetical protein